LSQRGRNGNEQISKFFLTKEKFEFLQQKKRQKIRAKLKLNHFEIRNVNQFLEIFFVTFYLMLDLIFLRHFGVKQRSITNAVLLIGDLKIFRIFNLISLFESLHSLVQCCKKHLELRKKIKYKIVG
jgi:hypothetical protein